MDSIFSCILGWLRIMSKIKINRYLSRSLMLQRGPVGLVWPVEMVCSLCRMTTLAGGFLVTNYHNAGCKVSKSNLDRGRKQKRSLRQTAADTWRG